MSHQVEIPRSPEGARRWAEALSLARPENDNFSFSIETLDGVLVGSTNTNECDRRHDTFKYGIGIFREHWRKGYASDAIRLLLGYYFDELAYHRCWTGIYATNQPSIRLHQKLGFQQEARLREHHFTGGQRIDEIIFGLLASEFLRE